MDFAVFGIGAAVLVERIVNLLKAFGVDGKWSLVAAVVVGLCLALLNQAMTLYPGIAPWYEAVVGGLIAAMAASKIYDITAAVSE